ncbi:MAG: Bax inhibitor-1/YccA family protein [Bacteroidota bacterium]
MREQNNIFQNEFAQENKPLQHEAASEFMRNVFTNMGLALLLTGLTAWFVYQSEQLTSIFLGNQIIFYIVLFAPLGLVWYLGSRIHKMSLGQATTVFAIYSVVNGITFSTIFFAYSMGSIANTFFITAGTFLSMVIVGYTTKVDLSKFSSIMYMALIGIVISLIVNMFLQSETFDYIISGIGVLLFCGLTAYDIQKLLVIGGQADPDTDGTRKIAIWGALQLYLDFINLFLFLLRFFGSRD